jgi:hypothetical protein
MAVDEQVVKEELTALLSQVVSDEYLGKIVSAMLPSVLEDLEENADEDEDYSDDDIKLAIGRELMDLYDLWGNY